MPERVALWWARRQFSRGAAVPYAVGRYREAWAPFPAVIRQYHPELNAGIVLTQIPPAADVLLLWQCEAGHLFAATPDEQRHRPDGRRRRSAWCPTCTELARPPAALPMRDAIVAPRPTAARGLLRPAADPPATDPTHTPATADADADAADTSATARGVIRARRPPRARRICPKTPDVPVGEPFASVCAPRPASAAEARMRADLFARLSLTPGLTAVRVARPFFDHVEVWPDLVLAELRVAIEYDSTGRHGLEHVGLRADADRRKDRALRAAGWEVVRLRTGRLEPIGPHDLQLSTWNRAALDRLVDALRSIRGPLLVDAYLT
jgi:hypothetical protein